MSAALVADPGRPATAVVAARFAKSELQIWVKRLLRKVGLARLQDVLPDAWGIPDSAYATRAIEYAGTLCPAFMIHHCFRSYCFGAILAARNQLHLDREVFFVAAMLHDLGLSETYASEPGSFEWVGAKLAYDFSVSQLQTDVAAAAVHNAIALHTSVGIAGGEVPEIALLHYGTGMDLFGMRLDEIPGSALKEILDRYPRSEFRQTFGQCLTHQARIKPDSQIAAGVGIGICDRILPKLI